MSQEISPSRLENEVIAQYLIAEFEVLHQRAQAHEQMVIARTNFFIALTTAVLGGLLLFLKEYVKDWVLLSVIIITTLLFLLIVGWTVFIQSIDSKASVAIYYRRAGRIRRWFVDNAVNIEKYIPFKATDARPLLYVPWAPLRHLNITVVSVNAGLSAILFSYVCFILLRGKLVFEDLLLIIGGCSIGMFALIFYWQFSIYKHRLLAKENSEEEKKAVHFPLD